MAHLRALAGQLGVGDRTEFPGAAEPAAVRTWLAQAALFALPSHVEGMPIVLLEAMSAGLPVVATRVGAVPAVVEPERSGLLVDAGDVDALASAIGRLLDDERLREAFGRNGARDLGRALQHRPGGRGTGPALRRRHWPRGSAR